MINFIKIHNNKETQPYDHKKKISWTEIPNQILT